VAPVEHAHPEHGLGFGHVVAPAGDRVAVVDVGAGVDAMLELLQRLAGLTLAKQQFNNALLKMTFRALRNISLNPWRVGEIVAAALVILHIGHRRIT
jgi:hypothetical protein